MAYKSKEARHQAYLNKREYYLELNKVRYQNKKEELLEYQKVYRKVNKELLNAKVKANRKNKLRQLVSLSGDNCQKCLQKFPDVVYDFHHINPELKSFSIGENMHKNINILIEEASKCMLLCSNCHRIAHDC